jgi:hypothetical protein
MCLSQPCNAIDQQGQQDAENGRCTATVVSLQRLQLELPAYATPAPCCKLHGSIKRHATPVVEGPSPPLQPCAGEQLLQRAAAAGSAAGAPPRPPPARRQCSSEGGGAAGACGLHRVARQLDCLEGAGGVSACTHAGGVDTIGQCTCCSSAERAGARQVLRWGLQPIHVGVLVHKHAHGRRGEGMAVPPPRGVAREAAGQEQGRCQCKACCTSD